MFIRAVTVTILVSTFSLAGAAQLSDSRVDDARRQIEALLTVPRLTQIDYCATAQPLLAEVFRAEIEPFKATAAQAARELAPRYAGGLVMASTVTGDRSGIEVRLRTGALSLAIRSTRGPFCRQLLQKLSKDSATGLSMALGKILDGIEKRLKAEFPDGLTAEGSAPIPDNLLELIN